MRKVTFMFSFNMIKILERSTKDLVVMSAFSLFIVDRMLDRSGKITFSELHEVVFEHIAPCGKKSRGMGTRMPSHSVGHSTRLFIVRAVELYDIALLLSIMEKLV